MDANGFRAEIKCKASTGITTLTALLLVAYNDQYDPVGLGYTCP